MTENNENIENDVNAKEVLDSISINVDDTDLKKIKKNKVETEIKESEGDNIIEDEEFTKELYDELSSFLENKAEATCERQQKETIPTGIDLLDAVLGGGFAVGALNIVVGQPGSGKSMLAMQTLGQGQKKYRGKLLGGFLDSEEATTSIRLANLGVRYPKLKPYIDITVEKVFKFIEGLCVFKQKKDIVDTPSVVVWDSIANTLTAKERETDDPNSVIGYKARLLSILVPKYISKCAHNNICFIAVNQLRDNISMGQFAPAPDLKMMTSSKTMPGGTILKYNAFQLLEMKVKTVISPGGTNDSAKYGFEGIICKVKCVKNKLFAPNVEIEIVGSFVNGFSNFWTNFNFLKETKRLTAASWNYLVNLPDKKFRTKDAPNLYKTDETFRNAFDAAVKEAIQTEIIDKYNPSSD
jgi:RecA/RadA recombinase